MKKILIALALTLPLGTSFASAVNDKVINKNELPTEAQKFIDRNFANVKLSYAKLETDFLIRSYEVALADGTRLEFTSNGEWEEIDCRKAEVPAAIIPAGISEYIKNNYPEEKINRIERDSRGYELELSNDLELKFNNDFAIVDIDD